MKFVLNCALNFDNMFNPPISVAANIFVIISVCLIAIGAAIIVVDVYKNSNSKKKISNKE